MAWAGLPKEFSFNLSVPEDTPVDVLLCTLRDFVGRRSLHSLQHRGGNHFQAVVKNEEAQKKLSEVVELQLGNGVVNVEPVGPSITFVTVSMLPTYVSDEHLVRALSPYGKILQIKHLCYKDDPECWNGNILVKLQMCKPPPNFLNVVGYNVMLNYRGMKQVCGRCKEEGHFRASCKALRCARCAVFGHATDGCSLPCRRCSGTHATVDCSSRKRYSDVVQGITRDAPAFNKQGVHIAEDVAESVLQEGSVDVQHVGRELTPVARTPVVWEHPQTCEQPAEDAVADVCNSERSTTPQRVNDRSQQDASLSESEETSIEREDGESALDLSSDREVKSDHGTSSETDGSSGDTASPVKDWSESPCSGDNPAGRHALPRGLQAAALLAIERGATTRNTEPRASTSAAGNGQDEDMDVSRPESKRLLSSADSQDSSASFVQDKHGPVAKKKHKPTEAGDSSG